MRHHEKNCFVSLATWIVLLSLQIHTQEASPVKRSIRMIREIYPEIEPEKDASQAQVCIVGDVVYGMDEAVPAEQPCLKCRCQPPGVQCETTHCVKKPGCRAIHKPNQCCPDYQCECEHAGRIYGNGERLEASPGGECKVCYCRGGEVQCAEVTCYIRTDCEGRTVPGQCCPKYDHCPPKEPLLERSPLLTTETTNAHTLLLASDSSITAQNHYRITELAKQYKENIDETNRIPDEKNLVDKSTQTDFTDEPYLIPEIADDSPKVVIQDTIPEVELVPVTTQINDEPHHLIIEETTETKNRVSNHNSSGTVLPQDINDLVITDSETEPSEVSEIYQHPPPVLRIGDKLLFLKKGEFVSEKDVSTPIPVITIIGAEGLQRGFEESGEVHEVSFGDSNETISKDDFENQSTNDLEVSGSASSHILSLVKFRNRHIEITTESNSEGNENSTTETSVVTDVITQDDMENFDFNTTIADLENVTFENEDDSSTTAESETSQSTSSPEESNSTESVDMMSSSTKMEDDSPIVDQNPAYPPIPDVMSPQNVEISEHDPDLVQIKTTVAPKSNATIGTIPKTEIASKPENVPNVIPNTTTISNLATNSNVASIPDAGTSPKKSESKILPNVLEMRNNKTIPQNISNIEWLKNESLINENAALPEEILNFTLFTDVDESTTPEVSTKTTQSQSIVLDIGGDRNRVVIPESTKTPAHYKSEEESIESLDDVTIETSKEFTTPKNTPPSIMSNENASVDIPKNYSPELDLVEMIPNLQESSEDSENQSEEIKDDFMIKESPPNNKPIKNDTKESSKPIPIDVEIFDMKVPLKKPNASEKPDEDKPKIKPERIVDPPAKTIGKRQNSAEDEAHEVFKQLDDELKSAQTSRSLTKQEEAKEAEKIFKELLEESTATSKPKIDSPQARNKETEVLQRVSDAISKFQLRDSKQSLDTSILGILRDFFSSQYKAYDRN